MQRRLRTTMVAAATAGAVALGTGTAYAEGIFKVPSDRDCTRSVDKDKAEKYTDFPSYHEEDAERNAGPKDLRDASGQVYYTHNEFCDGPRPWRGWDWHDSSYDTFHNKRQPGAQATSQDPDKNSYVDRNGYNDGYHYDKPHLDRDHIGVSKHPQYANH